MAGGVAGSAGLEGDPELLGSAERRTRLLKAFSICRVGTGQMSQTVTNYPSLVRGSPLPIQESPLSRPSSLVSESQQIYTAS